MRHPNCFLDARFNDNTKDLSGNGDFTVSTGSASYVDARGGRALNMGGSTALSRPGNIKRSEMTIEIVFKLTSDAGNQCLISDRDTAFDGTTVWANLPSATARRIVWDFGDGAASIARWNPSGGNYDLNTWVHVVLTRDDTIRRMYVNGVQTETILAPGGIAPGSGTTSIGSSGGGANLFSGELGRVRVYDQVFSASQIRRMYFTSQQPVRHFAVPVP